MQQEIDRVSTLPEPQPAKPTLSLRRLSPRSIVALLFCLCLLLLAVLPPLVSLNRYQRRVTTSMAQVLGRPVHLDHITLNLLPLPSFTLENLVIDELPPFGAEPIIRANTVNAQLRIGSLWRHRVEFSRITFTDPSVNLVHLPDGRWNLSGLLMQASHVDAAPTAQTTAGPAPRFPYIEATGARINLKLGQVKTPFSLTEAEFALWLPQPQQWKMRISARPARTDISVSDTGTLKLEAALNRASALGEVPLTADATWTDAPLGATSRIVTGTDADVRGQMTLSAHLSGQISAARLKLRVQADSLHRADFVPEHSLAVDIECTALATHIFHSLEDLRCVWPVPDSQGATVALAGALPDLLDLRHTAQLQIGTPQLPASALSTWAHVLSARIPGDTRATGTLAGTMLYTGERPGSWQGHATITGLALLSTRLGEVPFPIGDVALSTVASTDSTSLVLDPIPLNLGGHDPAILDGSANRDGTTLHLSGLIAIPRLLALAATAPQIGEGLTDILPRNRAAGPTRLDLTAHRAWGGHQVWTDNLDDPGSASATPPRPARPPPPSLVLRMSRLWRHPVGLCCCSALALHLD